MSVQAAQNIRGSLGSVCSPNSGQERIISGHAGRAKRSSLSSPRAISPSRHGGRRRPSCSARWPADAGWSRLRSRTPTRNGSPAHATTLWRGGPSARSGPVGTADAWPPTATPPTRISCSTPCWRRRIPQGKPMSVPGVWASSMTTASRDGGSRVACSSFASGLQRPSSGVVAKHECVRAQVVDHLLWARRDEEGGAGRCAGDDRRRFGGGEQVMQQRQLREDRVFAEIGVHSRRVGISGAAVPVRQR